MQKIQYIYQRIFQKNPEYISLHQKQKINFLEQLSNLINSGIPIMNGLKIMQYQTKQKKMTALIKHMLETMNKGGNLKQAFEKYPKIFSIFDISIIEMGEITGKLGESIETIRIKEEKSSELKSKIIGALVYPMVIISLAILMIIVFLVYVIPKIQDMYRDAQVNLPPLTENVILLSEFVKHNIFLILLCIIMGVIGIQIFKTHKKTKIAFDRFILHIPLFGKLIRKKILSLFSGSLGMLLENKVIINKSLIISAKALDNGYYEKELQKIILGINKGIELSTLMGINEIQSGKENFLFPIELASAIKIGEQTGKLDSLLTKLSLKYTKEIDNIVKNLQTVIEPLVIMIVGLIIGTLIIAIMLPFFNMVNVI